MDHPKEQVIPTNSREFEKYLFKALKKFTTLAIKHSIFYIYAIQAINISVYASVY